MERKIGEIFEYNGEWYQCVESPDGSCKHCDMNFDSKCPIPIKECTASGRNDKSYVIFKKLKKVGEQFLYKGKQMQSYIRATDELICNWNNNLLLLEHGDSDIIDIEIKQTKEDVEQEIEYFGDENAKCFNSESIEKNLKPFNLDVAKQGKPVCTRDGRKARIICFDRKDVRPLIALIQSDNGGEGVYYYYANGLNLDNYPSAFDLIMLPEKKEEWINIYEDMVMYASEEEAKMGIATERNYIATVKVEWEE